jgi:hypothetical protein
MQFFSAKTAIEMGLQNERESDSSMMESRSLTVIVMVEKQSEIGLDAQPAMLLRHKWQEEIEQAISCVKKSRTRTEADRWFRRQWYKALAVSKRCERRFSKQSDKRLRR